MNPNEKFTRAVEEARQRFADLLAVEVTLATARENLEAALRAGMLAKRAAYEHYCSADSGLPIPVAEESLAVTIGIKDEFYEFIKSTHGHFHHTDGVETYERIFADG